MRELRKMYQVQLGGLSPCSSRKNEIVKVQKSPIRGEVLSLYT